MNLKILYFTHPTAFNIFGGAEIQLIETKEWINKTQGKHQVKLFDIFNDKLENYDILHTFQMSPDCLDLCKMAKSKGLKLALSPIFWTHSEYKSATMSYLKFRDKIKFEAKTFVTHLKWFYENLTMYGYPTSEELNPYKQFLEMSDIILPNSEMEAILISRRFRINIKKFHVVPNGVDEKFFDAKPDLFIKKYGLENFVLFVGRIEKRKNILSLLEACKKVTVPLVIIGYPSPTEPEYSKAINKVINSDPNIHYLGFMHQDSEDLLSAYAAAKVFVLPSWFETPGLAALEAGLAGCNIVITNRGSTREYFKDLAWYVDPISVDDIASKISIAFKSKKTNQLKETILTNFTWKRTAEKTIAAYDTINT
jgi:glycosyltransferase involved in cell wall biosynthesis